MLQTIFVENFIRFPSSQNSKVFFKKLDSRSWALHEERVGNRPPSPTHTLLMQPAHLEASWSIALSMSVLDPPANPDPPQKMRQSTPVCLRVNWRVTQQGRVHPSGLAACIAMARHVAPFGALICLAAMCSPSWSLFFALRACVFISVTAVIKSRQ
jgi:hypothetical protein